METGIICVYGVAGKFYYRPFSTKNITEKVRAELGKHLDKDYLVARLYDYFIKTDEKGKLHKPNKQGYYTSEQIHAQAVEFTGTGKDMTRAPFIAKKGKKIVDRYTNLEV